MLSISAACAVASQVAAPAQPLPIASTPTLSFVPTQEIDHPHQPAISEFRRLTLEFPLQIRLGDSDVIRLGLEMDKFGNFTSTAEIIGHEVTGGIIEISDLYQTHHVIAEARLDLAGAEVRPSEVVSEPLLPGQSVTFYWSIRLPGTGVYRGTAWLHLRFVDKSNGEERRKALSAQTVEIEAVNFFGLSANFARTIGLLGLIVSGVLGFPFLEHVMQFFIRKRRK